jgi:hypothetical protein
LRALGVKDEASLSGRSAVDDEADPTSAGTFLELFQNSRSAREGGSVLGAAVLAC